MPLHDRRSVRLRGFDYRQPGLYVVTVCTFGRQPLFGAVRAGEMHRSAFGEIAHAEWLRTPDIRAGVVLDAFVVMPDHVHLLIGIVGDDASPMAGAPPAAMPSPTVGATRRVAPTERIRPFGPPARSLGAIIGQYKSVVTKQIRQLDPTLRVWQRGYYDRVVRTPREAEAIRRYVVENPARWGVREEEADGHRI